MKKILFIIMLIFAVRLFATDFDFTGDDDTPLSSYNPNCLSISSTYTVNNLEIISNQLQHTATWRYSGFYLNTSSSDSAQVVWIHGPGGVTRWLCVRAGTDNRGYAIGLSTISGANYTRAYLAINGVSDDTLLLATGQTWDTASNHTAKIVVSGTDPVTINTWMDGTPLTQIVDYDALLSAGHPGHYATETGAINQSVLDDWSDLTDVVVDTFTVTISASGPCGTTDPIPDDYEITNDSIFKIALIYGDSCVVESVVGATVSDDTISVTPSSDTTITITFAITGDQDLDEMTRRMPRRHTNYHGFRDFENAVTYINQGGLLCFEDTATSNEVWKLTDDSLNAAYSSDIGLSPWSADGKKVSLYIRGRFTAGLDSATMAEYVATNGCWYTLNSSGDSLRPLLNAPLMIGVNNYFNWSKQFPNTFYQRGGNYYGSSHTSTNTIYSCTVNGSGVVTVTADSVVLPPAAASVDISKMTAPAGNKLLAINETSGKYWVIDIDADGNLTNELDSGIYIDRGYGRPDSTFGDLTYDSIHSLHDQYMVGTGDKIFFLPAGTKVWFKLNTRGSDTDDGPLWSNDYAEISPENHQVVYWTLSVTDTSGQFSVGETVTFDPSGATMTVISYDAPETSLVVRMLYVNRETEPAVDDGLEGGVSGATATLDAITIRSVYSSWVNPSNYDADKTSYWSHFFAEPWGRLAIFSNVTAEVPTYSSGTGVWDYKSHSWIRPAYGDGAQHHYWFFSDWSISSSGDLSEYNVCTQIYKQNCFNDDTLHILVCNAYNTTFNDPDEQYENDIRPGLSPDGTKTSFASDFLAGVGSWDCYWVCNYKPYPPDSVECIDTVTGVGIKFIPPRYTGRHWIDTAKDSIDETSGEILFAREIKQYNIWRCTDTSGQWTLVGSITATYANDDTTLTLKPTFAGGWVDTLNKIAFVDTPPSPGTYYYAITSREHSGLESDELSAIIEVDFTDGFQSSSQTSAKGHTGFKTTAPTAVTVSAIYDTNYGQYLLTWTKPSDDDIRYFNIYYDANNTPSSTQRFRIASIPIGSPSVYRDWLVDSTKTNQKYTITSVDFWGNESDSMVIGSEGAPTVTIDTILKNYGYYVEPITIYTSNAGVSSGLININSIELDSINYWTADSVSGWLTQAQQAWVPKGWYNTIRVITSTGDTASSVYPTRNLRYYILRPEAVNP